MKKAENGIEYFTKMGYDKNGNMTSRQRSSIGGPVGDNRNMEISIGTMQSNPGSESVAEVFSYNALDQMVGYQNSNGTNATYAYDATGARVSKTVNGVEKKFYYDGMYILNEGSGDQITATNFIGQQGIEGRKDSASSWAFFMKDGHGDIRGAIDSTPEVVANYSYDIWGNETQENTNTLNNPFRYCGEYFDEESGFIYLRARYYDPDSGRFTQEDPARDGLNWYAYCENNPSVCIDPTGMLSYFFYSSKNTELNEYVGSMEVQLKNTSQYKDIKLIDVDSPGDFARAWNEMGIIDGKSVSIDLVVILLHGDPTGMSTPKGSIEQKNLDQLNTKEINTMVLISCNVGHQDYKNNIAEQLFSKVAVNRENTESRMIASDGTVFNTSQGFEAELTSIADDEFRRHSAEAGTFRMRNYGFIEYRKTYTYKDVPSIQGARVALEQIEKLKYGKKFKNIRQLLKGEASL